MYPVNGIFLPKLLPSLKEFEPLSFEEGTPVVHADDPLSGMFYITEGFVREMAVSKQGAELTLNIYGSGYCFPLSQLFINKPSSTNFQSLTPLKALHLPKEVVFSIVKNNHQLLFDISQKLTDSLFQTTKKIKLLVFEGSEQKIAYALLELAKYFGEKSGRKIIISKRFTHYDISTIAGLTRETTSKILEDFMKKGIIKYENHKLIITDIKIFKFTI